VVERSVLLLLFGVGVDGVGVGVEVTSGFGESGVCLRLDDRQWNGNREPVSLGEYCRLRMSLGNKQLLNDITFISVCGN